MTPRHGERSVALRPWSPEGFPEWIRHYPNTAWEAVPEELDATGAFIARWEAADPLTAERVPTVVVTPGLFSEFLPRCFAPAISTLEAARYRVVRTRVRSRYGVREQAARLGAELKAKLRSGERFIWCGHSKGAIDLLYTLESTPPLRDSCAAAVVVQPAVGKSAVVDRWQNSPCGMRERAGGMLLASRPVRNGVREISTTRDPQIADWLATFRPVVPTLCAVSWSIRPTSWVDSYHRTLNEVAPGHAHDGQFFLPDQRLAHAKLVCLPEIDHAQPVLGGHGFDAGRFWRTLVETALR